jgi:flagellar protein FliJ
MSGKTFQFRLESVLKLRRHETELARRELASAMSEVAEARQALEASERQLQDLLDLPSNRRSLPVMRRLAEMRSASIDVIHRTEALLTEALELELQSREVVFDRLRRQEALEKLETHQRDEFEEMQRKAQQLMLDEFAVIGHVRKKLPTL